MRPKIVLSVVALALLLLLGLSVLRNRDDASRAAREMEQTGLGGSGTGTATKSGVLATKGTNAHASREDRAADRLRATQAPQGGAPLTEGDADQREMLIEQRVAELMELAMDDDPNSLAQILAEMTNSELEIRKGAIEAVKQFGSADAIPKLKETAARTEDPSEKAALAEAIEFLSSSSLIAAPATPGAAKPSAPITIKPTKWNNRQPRSGSSGSASS
jgi:hypothetical protein